MYARSAHYYDLLYGFKDYAREARQIAELIRREHPGATRILDVACGTAEHLKNLAVDYKVAGLDIEPEFVAIAGRKLPDTRFWTADMSDFELGARFDVVLSLFSSIGYLRRPEQVVSAFRCFRRHLSPGGIIIVEPWFSPDQWTAGYLQMLTVDRPELKICRMSASAGDGALSSVRFHYLVGRAEGVEYFEELHELVLRTPDEMMGYFVQAGLEATHDPEGIFGRGLFVAKPE